MLKAGYELAGVVQIIETGLVDYGAKTPNRRRENAGRTERGEM
jgi:hypothetical protein